MKSKARQHGWRRRWRGISLTEVVVSTMLVGIILVGAMDCLAAVLRGSLSTTDVGRGRQLAEQLLTEILATSYLEPVAAPLFGPEADESVSNRLDFDDVDDFDAWAGNPPQDRGGDVCPNTTGWQREVVVEWVNPNNPQDVSMTDQGVKRITVLVRHEGTVVAQSVAIRGNAAL